MVRARPTGLAARPVRMSSYLDYVGTASFIALAASVFVAAGILLKNTRLHTPGQTEEKVLKWSISLAVASVVILIVRSFV